MPPKLGIIAGGGTIPGHLIEHCKDQGRDIFVIAVDGHADNLTLENVPHIRTRLGAVGQVIFNLQERNVEELVFIGSIRRPSLAELRPDTRGTKILMKAGKAAFGDSGLLSAVIDELEEEGFTVVGADEIVADLLAPLGTLGTISPDDQAKQDIKRGKSVVTGLGILDVGQAAVVQEGYVLAVEAAEGTDSMLSRCGGLKRHGPGGVLVKCRKPGQDRRIDLPTIGPNTVASAAVSGLRGIAVEAGHTLIIDRATTIKAAERDGLFITGFEAE